MLVVIDANVFVSAAIGRGASHRIIESWLSGSAEFEVVMCPKLLGEIREVLTTRPRQRRWISLENATLFVDTVETIVDLVDDPDTVETETRDSHDDVIPTSLGTVGAGETEQFCRVKKRVDALRDRPSDLKQYAGTRAVGRWNPVSEVCA